MSQINKQGSGGSGPGGEITFLTEKLTSAITSGGSITFKGTYTSDNDANGIRTEGSSGGTILNVSLTNRGSNFLTTTTTSPTELFRFSLPIEGTYSLDVHIAAYNSTDKKSCCFRLFIGMRSTGTVATRVDQDDQIVNGDSEMALTQVAVSSVGDSMKIDVVGLAGKSIKWVGVVNYVHASI